MDTPTIRQTAAHLVERRKNPDIEHVRKLQSQLIEALTVAHRGLTAITQTEDLEYAKRLAKQTLDEMRGIVEGDIK